MDKLLETKMRNLIEEKVSLSLKKSGITQAPSKPTTTNKVLPVVKGKPEKKVLKEALIATPRTFILKTEKLSRGTKEIHENLYKKYVQTFNKVSSELDATNKYEANSGASNYRSLKMNECYNLNAIKLHELYFNNISDLASEIAVDSLPYMKLSRDYGNFENWQFDFMACAMSAREGWAVTVFEPFKNSYMNICVDDHATGIPMGAVPVLVLDMWSHSYFKDYEIDKRSYLVSMMREINWDVVEARMALAEKSDLDALYYIKPSYEDESSKMLDNAAARTEVPIDNVASPEGNSVPPTTPPQPMQPMTATVNSALDRGNVR